MRHWYREPFSTYQFYADVLFEFERAYPDEELDLLESSRDRHGYDCVLIKRGNGRPKIRYVQLKSTEKTGAMITNIHDFMLLESYREIIQIKVLDSGKCEYHCLSDVGRVVYLALAIAGECQKTGSNVCQVDVAKALGFLSEMVADFSAPKSFAEVLSQWTNVPAKTLMVWDDALQSSLPRLWRKVLKPLTDAYESVFPNREKSMDLNSCWTRMVKREDLVRYLFRGPDVATKETPPDIKAVGNLVPVQASRPAALPSPRPKEPIVVRAPPRAKTPSSLTLADHVEQVLAHLRRPAAARPKTRAKLVCTVITHLGKKLTNPEKEADKIIERLLRGRHIEISERDIVSYRI